MFANDVLVIYIFHVQVDYLANAIVDSFKSA